MVRMSLEVSFRMKLLPVAGTFFAEVKSLGSGCSRKGLAHLRPFPCSSIL